VYFGHGPTFPRYISPPTSGSTTKPRKIPISAYFPASDCFVFGLLLDPEDVGHTFLENVGLSSDYTAMLLRKLSAFYSPP
jgi:hypothetical protein